MEGSIDTNCRILVFGQLADITGKRELNLSGFSTTTDLTRHLEETYPELSQITYSVALNKKMVTENCTLRPGDELALLPPFSGG